MLMEIPPEYDPDVYRNHPLNPTLKNMSVDEAFSHYVTYGREEGRISSLVSDRNSFSSLIPEDCSVLEIGPSYSPQFTLNRRNTYYLDVMDRESIIAAAPPIHAELAERTPPIDFLWNGMPYTDITHRKFDIVYSSHNIEHQPCLIRHLLDVHSILNEGGYFFLVIPDKRYTFDHFKPASTIAQVLSSYHCSAQTHALQDLLEGALLNTHNDPALHWLGRHGSDPNLEAFSTTQIDLIDSSIAQYKSSRRYLDAHKWKLTPDYFSRIVDNLNKLGLCKFDVCRIFPTVKNSLEFFVILQPSSLPKPSVR